MSRQRARRRWFTRWETPPQRPVPKGVILLVGKSVCGLELEYGDLDSIILEDNKWSEQVQSGMNETMWIYCCIVDAQLSKQLKHLFPS